jgi:hypothetical protein
MASSWGTSWGTSWGDSWGAVADAPRTQGDPGAGPSRSHRKPKKARPGRRIRALIYADEELTPAAKAPAATSTAKVSAAAFEQAVATVAPDYGAFSVRQIAETLPRKVYVERGVVPSQIDLMAAYAALLRIELARAAERAREEDEDDIELLLIAAA